MTQDVGTGDSSERPIRLGGALITMVEPHRGHEVAYDRWYERDHFYAGCMIGAWTVQGSRYVATRDLKALRYPADSPICRDPTSGSYIAIYWILAGKLDEWIRWGTDQVRWLHERGRMFSARDHVHTAMYRFRSEYRAREDGVPVELALDHRSPYWCSSSVVRAPARRSTTSTRSCARAARRRGRGVRARSAARRCAERRAARGRVRSVRAPRVRR